MQGWGLRGGINDDKADAMFVKPAIQYKLELKGGTSEEFRAHKRIKNQI